VPLGYEFQVQQPGVARRGIDGALQVQLIGCALARETPQLAQGELQIARAQFHGVVEVAEVASLPDLDGTALSRAGGTDADALGVVAARAKRGGTAGADPLVAALVTLLLLTQALTQRLEQFVPASEGLDAALLSFRERALGECSHPVRGDLGEQLREAPFGAGKHLGKDAIEAIVVAFVLNETGAREVVEILRRQLRHARPQCLQEHQELGGGHRHARAAQLKEELHQHGGSALSAPGDA